MVKFFFSFKLIPQTYKIWDFHTQGRRWVWNIGLRNHLKIFKLNMLIPALNQTHDIKNDTSTPYHINPIPHSNHIPSLQPNDPLGWREYMFRTFWIEVIVVYVGSTVIKTWETIKISSIYNFYSSFWNFKFIIFSF